MCALLTFLLSAGPHDRFGAGLAALAPPSLAQLAEVAQKDPHQVVRGLLAATVATRPQTSTFLVHFACLSDLV